MVIVVIGILTIVNALVLYFFVGKVNENLGVDAQFSPTVTDALIFSLIGSVLVHFLPKASWLYWIGIFKFKFGLNAIAIIICFIIQAIANYAIIMGLLGTGLKFL